MKSLFKARLRQLKNTAARFGWRKYLIFLLLSGGILGLMVFFSIKVFGFLYHQQEFPLYFKLFLSEKILMMTFLTMFLMLILSALISTLNIFFLSKDLSLLLTSPLRSRTVFTWKALEVAAASALMVIFFSMPMLFAYSYYFAPTLINIAAIGLVFLLFITSGVLIGILIGLIIPAFFSAKKLQPVLSLVSIVLISGIVIFLRMLRPERFGNPDVINNLLEYMGGLSVKGFAWFPFYWIARALHLVAQGDIWGYGKAIGAFIVIILLMGGFLQFLQKKYYLQLFDKLNKGTPGTHRSGWKKPRLFKKKYRDYSTLWKKEIKTFFRSPDQWSQLLIIAAIVTVFILNMKGIPLPHVSVKNLIAYLNMGMAAFIVAGLNSRFTFTAIPMESPGIAHLMASPFEKKKLFHFKLLFYVIPQMIVGFLLFFTGDIALHLDAFTRIGGIIFLAPALPFLTVLALYFSLKIQETVPITPQHLVMSRSGISYMLWSAIYVVACMIYFVRPFFLYHFNRIFQRPIPYLEICLWLVGFLLINSIMIVFFYKRSISIWNNKEFTASF
jgi:ABC-2 type transport system permease protein